MKNAHSTALILFARSAEEESRYKKLSANAADNRFLLRSLTRRSLQVARNTGLPLFHFNEKSQAGDTFGERLSASVQSVLACGYRKVIIMGSDCPEISVADIRRAGRLLTDHSIVVGPDQRGGTFLMGFRGESFDTQSITSLDWQQSTLLQSLQKLALERKLTMGFLSVKADLNHAADIRKYVKESAFVSLLIYEMTAPAKSSCRVCLQSRKYDPVLLMSRRGPPHYGSAA